jgi:hypothetical protein
MYIESTAYEIYAMQTSILGFKILLEVEEGFRT